MVLKYAKPSRLNLDKLDRGCLQVSRESSSHLPEQRRLIASPVLLPRWVGYFPEVNRSGPRGGIPARFRLFQLHGTRRLLTTIHHTLPPHSGTSELLRFMLLYGTPGSNGRGASHNSSDFPACPFQGFTQPLSPSSSTTLTGTGTTMKSHGPVALQGTV